MTSFAPTFTPRYRAHYTAAGVEHSIQFRGSRGQTSSSMESEFGTLVTSIFNTITSLLADDFAFISAEVALTDEDTFAPVTTPTSPVGTVDATTFTPSQKVSPLVFSGRAPGSRARLMMFGFAFNVEELSDPAVNGVITATEVAGVGSIASALSSHAKANSGVQAIWYPRATYKVNDKLWKKVRRGFI